MCLAGLIAVLAISGLRMGLKTDPLRSLAPPAHFHNNGRSYNLLMEGEVHQWDLSRLKGVQERSLMPEFKEGTLKRLLRNME